MAARIGTECGDGCRDCPADGRDCDGPDLSAVLNGAGLDAQHA
jgi:hypothetical protein